MVLRTLVWNGDERRLRAPLRIGILVVATVFLFVGTGLVASVALPGLRSLMGATAGRAAAETAAGVFGVVLSGSVVVLAVLFVARYVDRRRIADLGLRVDREWWLDCGFGLALGAGLMTLLFAVELAAGWLRVTGTLRPREGFAIRLLGLVVAFLAVGVYEELLARGYLLTNVAEGLVGWLGERGAVAGGVCCSSVLFGLGHANNPSATLASTVAIVLAGAMLAAGYVLTGELAIPIGLHATWNLFQGGVYGFPVSGIGVGASVVAVETSGPRLLTGGRFGPEAGLLGVGAMALGTVAIAAWVRWRTGSLALDSRVTTPALRAEPPERASDADRRGPPADGRE